MTQSNSINIRFWGVCGSYPMPGPSKLRHGGNTPCVEVQVNGWTLILDAGTGIIPLGNEIIRRSDSNHLPVEAVLLFSHFHHDHTQGFPFFLPAYLPSAKLHLFSLDFGAENSRAALKTVMSPPHFPLRLEDMKAQMDFESFYDGDELLLGQHPGEFKLVKTGEAQESAGENMVHLQVLKSSAHPGGVGVFRITWRGRSLVYATDMESASSDDSRLSTFAHGADILIHDAQYTDEHYQGRLPGLPTTQGYGHSTASMACHTAQAAHVQRLVLFHQSPEYDDDRLDLIEAEARGMFPNTDLAYEGMTLRI